MAAELQQLRACIEQGPLVDATPLQSVLSSILDQLHGLAGRVDALQQHQPTDVTAGLQLLKQRVLLAPPLAASAAGPSSCGSRHDDSFAQADLLRRLEAVEKQAAQLDAAHTQLQLAGSRLEPRLHLCETRLAGCDNIAGRLLTLDVIAAEVGVAVSPGVCMMTAHELSSGSQAVAGLTQPSQQQLQQPSAAPVGSGSGGVLTVSRHAVLQAQIDAGRQQLEAVQQHLSALQAQVDDQASEAAAASSQQGSVLTSVQDSVATLSGQLVQHVATLRRDMRPALAAAEVQQLSVAEFGALQSRVEAASAASAALAAQLADLKAKDLTALSTNLAQLSRSVMRVTGGPGAVSDTERALATTQAEMRGQLQRCASRLAALEAAQAAADDAQGEHSGAHDDSVRGTISRAVALALQQYRSCLSQEAEAASGGGGDGAAASRTRCLVCERTVRSPSPTPAGGGGGGGGSMGALLPCRQPPGNNSMPQPAEPASVSLYSPTAAPAATLATAAADAPAGSRLGSTAASGGGSSLGPKGPGVNAARHRHASAQQAGRPATAVAASHSCSSAGGLGPVNGLMVADLVSSNLSIGPAPGVTGCSSSGSGGSAGHDVMVRSDPGCARPAPVTAVAGPRRPTTAVAPRAAAACAASEGDQGAAVSKVGG